MYMRHSIILATRLKRKIFLAGSIPPYVRECAEAALSDARCVLRDIQFFDFGCIFYVDAPDTVSSEEIARTIRIGTSKPVRERFMELWSIPSLWTKRFCDAGDASAEDARAKAAEFFATVKSR